MSTKALGARIAVIATVDAVQDRRQLLPVGELSTLSRILVSHLVSHSDGASNRLDRSLIEVLYFFTE